MAIVRHRIEQQKLDQCFESPVVFQARRYKQRFDQVRPTVGGKHYRSEQETAQYRLSTVTWSLLRGICCVLHERGQSGEHWPHQTERRPAASLRSGHLPARPRVFLQGRNRHLSFFGTGRSNRKRRLPPHRTASGRIGRGAVIAGGDLHCPELADCCGLAFLAAPPKHGSDSLHFFGHVPADAHPAVVDQKVPGVNPVRPPSRVTMLPLI